MIRIRKTSYWKQLKKRKGWAWVRTFECAERSKSKPKGITTCQVHNLLNNLCIYLIAWIWMEQGIITYSAETMECKKQKITISHIKTGIMEQNLPGMFRGKDYRSTKKLEIQTSWKQTKILENQTKLWTEHIRFWIKAVNIKSNGLRMIEAD